jgi:hypothetical protein
MQGHRHSRHKRGATWPEVRPMAPLASRVMGAHRLCALLPPRAGISPPRRLVGIIFHPVVPNTKSGLRTPKKEKNWAATTATKQEREEGGGLPPAPGGAPRPQQLIDSPGLAKALVLSTNIVSATDEE